MLDHRTTKWFAAGIVAACVVSGCGSSDDGASPKSTTSSSTSGSPSSAASDSPVDQEPAGKIAATLDCKKLTAPAGTRPAPSDPTAVGCSFESATTGASVTITDVRAPKTYIQLENVNKEIARNSGAAEVQLERLHADGWTFAAIYPVENGFSREERYLVDSSGKVLICKFGGNGPSDGARGAEFCDKVKALVYTG